MPEGITLATAITIRPIVRLHKTQAVTTAVQVTSADAGNSGNSLYASKEDLRGISEMGFPAFVNTGVLFTDRIDTLAQNGIHHRSDFVLCAPYRIEVNHRILFAVPR